MLEVDRTGGEHDGNVYVCWSRFTGVGGQNKAYFSRSTDSGRTFSKPIAISRSNEVKSIQGCDISIEADGDVFVTFRTFTTNPNFQNGLAFAIHRRRPEFLHRAPDSQHHPTRRPTRPVIAVTACSCAPTAFVFPAFRSSRARRQTDRAASTGCTSHTTRSIRTASRTARRRTARPVAAGWASRWSTW